MGRIAKSFAITRESWNVLRSEKSLVLFPLISATASVLIFASFAVPIGIALWSRGGDLESMKGSTGYQIAALVLSFFFYFITFTVANYCNVALVGCALEVFEGRPASIAIGLRIANSRLSQILMWSAVAATVGMILRAIEERAGLIGRLVIGLIGMAWAIATFFVVPILVVEGVGPIDAVKRSAGIIKKNWGESLIAMASVTIVAGLAMVLIILVTALAAIGSYVATQSVALAVALAVVGFLAVMLVALIGSTLKEIVNAALYRYATTGVVASGFSASSLQGVFAQKNKR